MRNIWLMPDREQDGMAYAIDGERVAPFNEIIDLKTLPPELVIGIPEEILRRNNDKNFIYAQLAKLRNNLDKDGNYVFCLSSPAGYDKSGRVVFITNVQILSPIDDPIIPPKRPSGFPSNLDIWAERFDDTESSAYDPVFQMLDARLNNPSAKSFSSERLQKSRFTPDWMPQKKNIRTPSVFIYSIILILFLSIILIVARSILGQHAHWLG